VSRVLIKKGIDSTGNKLKKESAVQFSLEVALQVLLLILLVSEDYTFCKSKKNYELKVRFHLNSLPEHIKENIRKGLACFSSAFTTQKALVSSKGMESSPLKQACDSAGDTSCGSSNPIQF
jgi:hypothetical protein